MVRCSCASVRVGMKSTSSFCIGMSATRPVRIPSTSTEITSSVRSAFLRCKTACGANATSVNPSAASINPRTLLMRPPTSYIPGRNTAPLISTMFSYLGITESTLIESSSATRKLRMSNSFTLKIEYWRPVFLRTRTERV